jgi:long-chain acyl-CoA synthetase
MNIGQLLANAARSFGDKPAVCVGPRQLFTYAELCGRVGSLAAAVRRRFALEEGQRVAIVMTNTPEYLEVLFSAWWAGLVCVPINARLHPKEIAYILEKSNAQVCFINDEVAASLHGLDGKVPGLKAFISVGSSDYSKMASGKGNGLVYRRSDDPAWLFFTSGTTGHPKAATLTHRNLMMMSLSYLADITPATYADTLVHAAPMSHGSGLLAIPHVAKASKNVILESKSLNHDEIFNLFGCYHKITMYHTPTMLKRLVNHRGLEGAKLDSLRTVFYGGSPMYLTDLKQAIDRLGPRIAQMWAQAETPNTGTHLSIEDHMDTSHPRYLERLSSAGIARTGVELRIGDSEDRALPPGELGEVLVRGDTVMAGYWDAPEATAETLRNGWLHTGDLGSMDEDGFLTIKDRAKDMIISGGFNIYPREIEEILLQHPNVLEVSVIGEPHPDLVEQVIACVVKRPGCALTENELDALCLENLARFKRPRSYHFLSDLPKSYYGKVLKRELRTQVLREDG